MKDAAATNIQGVYRMRDARKKVRKKRHERKVRCSEKIQRSYRSHKRKKVAKARVAKWVIIHVKKYILDFEGSLIERS